MKSLKTIQTVYKVIKVVTLIGMILCFVGAGFAVLGGSLVLSLPDILGDEMMGAIVETGGLEDIGILEAGLVSIAGAIVALAQGVCLIFAYKYFKRTCEDGTPFTYGGAKQLKDLGLITIFVTIGAYFIAELFLLVFGISTSAINESTDITVPLIMLFMSAVYKYGASLEDKAKDAESEVNDTVND